MEEDIVLKIANKLNKEMLTEILAAAKENRLTGSLLVSKVRDYNRKWNKTAKIHPELQIDGFKKFAKREMLDQPSFKDLFESSLKYL